MQVTSNYFPFRTHLVLAKLQTNAFFMQVISKSTHYIKKTHRLVNFSPDSLLTVLQVLRSAPPVPPDLRVPRALVLRVVPVCPPGEMPPGLARCLGPAEGGMRGANVAPFLLRMFFFFFFDALDIPALFFFLLMLLGQRFRQKKVLLYDMFCYPPLSFFCVPTATASFPFQINFLVSASPPPRHRLPLPFNLRPKWKQLPFYSSTASIAGYRAPSYERRTRCSIVQYRSGLPSSFGIARKHQFNVASPN